MIAISRGASPSFCKKSPEDADLARFLRAGPF